MDSFRSKKMRRLRERVTTAEREAKRLKEVIKKVNEEHAVPVDADLCSDLSKIVMEQTEGVRKECPEDTFRRIFWEEQLAAVSKKDKRQIRWHPLMIRWCLNLKLISSAAYHCTRTSGFLHLPSERTLRDYSNHIQTRTE